jgi:pSer/pThr/pTyr-binding forkhead associated (FHA) protein
LLVESTRDKQIPPIELKFKPQAGELEEKRFYLPEFFIGRDPVCECLLEDETVSSKHARISYRQNQWWVEDLDSSNGTFLNSQPVTLPTVLADNDQLRCGQVDFKISFGN